MTPSTPSSASAAVSTQAEPFQFLYFSQLSGQPVVHAVSGESIGTLWDFNVQATTPYPLVNGVHVRTPGGLRTFPWKALQSIAHQTIYLLPETPDPVPPSDYTIRSDLLRKKAVEVSDTTIVRIWDLHFVYSEEKMVLAHAETGLRGILRTIGLEKPVVALFGNIFKAALREKFATFRHLQVLRRLPDGSVHVPNRVLEMHPADLAAVLRQLSGRLCRIVFSKLPDDAAAAVLSESEARLQRRLLAACPRKRRHDLQDRMKTLRDLSPL